MAWSLLAAGFFRDAETWVSNLSTPHLNILLCVIRYIIPQANGNGRAPAPVNGYGHNDEVPESQQSLFSWAEFMAEEPVKPRGRSRKSQPATLSMFEWALTLEQKRETEQVGAGR